MPAFTKAPLEAAVWYLAPFWAGVLTNLTTDKLPISRLTASDLSRRSGAIAALVIIVVIVVIIVANQVCVIRKTGWLPHYLKWYILGGLVTLLRQDGPQGSLLPEFLTNSTNFNASIPLVNQVIAWDGLSGTWDGFSLLVDDVERYLGTALNFSLAAFDPTIPHFFRLAYTWGGDTGDFTMPATLWPNGTWVDPLPGPS
ncbi:hypothetical protein DXG03_008954 [Asterophora parasitica]|uniref:Uncharacterized protein n=1 Tax=Asterophora parasitica TaxID=117018 RepID=A0A9P7GD07_9AGAR|nr:hypothetical protein DXG03_008954 [Asterophora parasitica]